MKRAILLIVTAGAILAGCANRDITMRNLDRTNGDGPEEFAVLPVKPLQQPQSYNDLPAPTPGAANLTDPTPRADAIAALGGNPAAGAGAIPAADAALVRGATRYGVPANIRADLAQDDLEFRRRASLFTKLRLFKVDRYNQAYRRQVLDPFAERDRFQRAGIRTPSAPPTGGE